MIEVGKPGKAVHMNSLSPLECVEEEWEFEVVLGYGMRTSESKTDRQTDRQDGEGLHFEAQPATLATPQVLIHHFPDCFMQRVLRTLEILIAL